jgi:hypothetical protein
LRYANHKSLSAEIQPVLEGVIGGILDRTALSFLCGRFAEQRELSETEIAIFYGIGGLASLFQGAQIFYPYSITKYHKRVDVNLESEEYKKNPELEAAVTQEERDTAYEAFYGTMSRGRRIWEEAKRPLWVGYAQTWLSMQFIITRLEPYLTQNMPEEAAILLAGVTGLAVSAIAFKLFENADLYRELNERAYQARKIKASVDKEKSALATVRIYEDEKNQPLLNHKLEEPAFALPGQTLPMAETDSQADEEEEEEIRPNKCAVITGTAVSVVMNALRIFSLTSSFVNNQKIKNIMTKTEWVGVSAGVGTIIGDNRHRAMTDSSIQTISKFFKCGREKPAKVQSNRQSDIRSSQYLSS